MQSALQGAGLSLIICFLVLAAITRNLQVSSLAITCIGSIIAFILSTIHLLGWTFGLIESTCMIVFIGISFDYVVHIAHCYLTKKSDDR